jgi:hypothetical protein
MVEDAQDTVYSSYLSKEGLGEEGNFHFPYENALLNYFNVLLLFYFCSARD